MESGEKRNAKQDWSGVGKPSWDMTIQNLSEEDMHILAGVCLYGYPGGFSVAEVERLHAIADDIRPSIKNADAIEFLHDLAQKINRLLPPSDRAEEKPTP